MTITGEARVLETDAIIFTTETDADNRQQISIEEKSNEVKLDDGTNKISIETRFARLKKSLRKRSVSIL